MSAERKQAKQAEPTSPQERRGKGHPKSYKSAEELDNAINAYWDSLRKPRRDSKGQIIIDELTGGPLWDDESVPPTEADLLLYLGIDRRTWGRYEDEESTYPDYCTVIARARLRLEGYANRMLFTRDGSKGAAMQLERRHPGWEAQQTININATHTVALPEQDVTALGAVIAQWQQLQSAAQAAQQIASGPVVDVEYEPSAPL